MERVMPLYRGIASLRRAGDSIQYGGPLLCTDGVCPGLPDGRARFVPIAVAPTTRAPDEFVVSTRRGKQFNSMTQSDRDALTGTRSRDAVFMAASDARRLGLDEGAALELVSELGRFRGRCRLARVVPGTLQVYWPEGNVLIGRRLDPASGEPDYNAVVRVVAPARESPSTPPRS
jgi:anaerobic selenocysteine-containing dehydrogenase